MTTFLIAHAGHTIKSHEHISWWKPDSRGYTICINKAGRYTEVQARAICITGSSCIAVAWEHADKVAKGTPYYITSKGERRELYDGLNHRVVPNSSAAWIYLYSHELTDCGQRPKPTPMPASKARSVYQ
jgi:hypothetical protein